MPRATRRDRFQRSAPQREPTRSYGHSFSAGSPCSTSASSPWSHLRRASCDLDFVIVLRGCLSFDSNKPLEKAWTSAALQSDQMPNRVRLRRLRSRTVGHHEVPTRHTIDDLRSDERRDSEPDENSSADHERLVPKTQGDLDPLDSARLYMKRAERGSPELNDGG